MATIYEERAKIFKALSDERRLRILEVLQNGEKCTCTLTDEVNMPQSSLSYHMKILVSVGIVEMRNEGKYVFYSLRPEIIRQFLHEIEDMFTENENCICRTISKMPCMDSISDSE